MGQEQNQETTVIPTLGHLLKTHVQAVVREAQESLGDGLTALLKIDEDMIVALKLHREKEGGHVCKHCFADVAANTIPPDSRELVFMAVGAAPLYPPLLSSRCAHSQAHRSLYHW